MLCYQQSKFGQLCSFLLHILSFRTRGCLSEQGLLIWTECSPLAHAVFPETCPYTNAGNCLFTLWCNDTFFFSEFKTFCFHIVGNVELSAHAKFRGARAKLRVPVAMETPPNGPSPSYAEKWAASEIQN